MMNCWLVRLSGLPAAWHASERFGPSHERRQVYLPRAGGAKELLSVLHPRARVRAYPPAEVPKSNTRHSCCQSLGHTQLPGGAM